MGLLSIAFAVLLGCGLAYRFGRLTGSGPVWAQASLVVGAGIGLGAGLTAVIFFVSRVLVPLAMFAPAVEAVLGAWLAWEIYRMPRASASSPARLNWILALGVLAVVGLSIVAFSEAWSLNPQGAWDAFSIWNVRAKFLAAPQGLEERAWSPLLQHTQPGYPMLLSSFIGRAWAYSGSFDSAVPMTTSLLFFVGTLALGAGGLAIARSPSIGLVFALVLAASPSVLHEVPAQYADIPLAYYFLGAVALTLLNRPLLGGAFAGLATFTKNEGVVFLVVAVLALAVARKRVDLFLLAASPFAILTAVFKFGLAAGVGGVKTGGGNSTQLDAILAAFVSEFVNLGAGFYHPLLPVAALALLWGIDKRYRLPAFTAFAISGIMLAAYFGVFLFTGNDVSWQLGTALPRLYAQVWPMALFGCVFLLRSPDEKTV